MKKNIICLYMMVAASLGSVAQTMPGFLIDYKSSSAENPDDNRTVLKSWVTEKYSKTFSASDDMVACITDHDKGEYTVLIPGDQQYMKISGELSYSIDGSTNDPNLPIDFTSTATQKIAGYTTNLAQVALNLEDEGHGMVNMKIWYSRELPSFYWNKFPYFKNIPGAVLAIDIDGEGFRAASVSALHVDIAQFGVPVFYADKDYADLSAISDEQLADNLISFYDVPSSKYGLKDNEGNIITEPIYGHITAFEGDVAMVIDSTFTYYGSIDKQGQILLPITYENLSFNALSNTYIYYENEKYGLLDAQGTVIMEPTYDMLGFGNKDIYVFHKGDKVGLVNASNKVIMGAKYGMITEVFDNSFAVYEKEEYTLRGLKRGNKIAGPFSTLYNANVDGLFLANKKDKYGVINEQGKVVVPFKFYYLSQFDNGVALVMEDEDSSPYYINVAGEKVGDYDMNIEEEDAAVEAAVEAAAAAVEEGIEE